ncbi:S-layer homology domain-containing protein [uncultured Oscillibacter sp.]|uniref:S-layer homology domain-containing protein n=1 Tax=uncultured Oscillibacter sp. TaxID=876091 RepID=UPI002634477D|nr:S-layer homology domain-containing protein [uncultured Oscillibacter sp.]
MKRLCSLVLALALCLGLCVPAGAAEFSDVPGAHTFHDAVVWCSGQSIVNGYEDNTFRPANTVSRSNFTVMLSRAFFAADIEKYKSPIYISSGTFWANYQAMMANQALNNTSFADDTDNVQEMSRSISRYDMAQLITNIMTRQGFPASSSDKSAAIAKITDYNNIPSQYRDAVANVYALGIITGYSDGSFSGEVTMNRGQAAVVIYRMMQYSGNSGGNITNPDPETPAEPETPSKPSQPEQTGKTLANGKPVTEDNILELLSELQAKYPDRTSFVNGYSDGGSSTDVRTPVRSYKTSTGRYCSTSAGCGGWAALVSDYIFGQTGFPARKIATADARPGDICITLNGDGELEHVQIITERPWHNDECQWMEFLTTDGDDSKTPDHTYVITWNNRAMDWDNPQPGDWTAVVWTRYPN